MNTANTTDPRQHTNTCMFDFAIESDGDDHAITGGDNVVILFNIVNGVVALRDFEGVTETGAVKIAIAASFRLSLHDAMQLELNPNIFL